MIIIKRFCFFFLCAVCMCVSCDKTDETEEIIVPVVKRHYLPLMTIKTDGFSPIESKDYYLNATIGVETRDSLGQIIEQIFIEKTEIKGRGNSTWGMPKKPYRLKLTDKAEMFGMPANKHWALLANYSDKTLMRNVLAFEISRRMSFAYTPKAEFVDLKLNNAMQGNYLLTEHVRIDPTRVNIPELKAKATNITGGYLLEIDERQGEPEYFYTDSVNMIFCIKSPENIPANQKKYISEHVQKLENALYDTKNPDMVKNLEKYLDLKSFIDYYLLNELARNVDGNLRLSTFVYKNIDDDKLYFGPVWDYDISFGNANYDGGQYTSGWQQLKAPWYANFFKNSELSKKVKDRWKELRAEKLQISELNAFIDKTAERLEKSQQYNFYYWSIMDKVIWPNSPVKGGYLKEVEFLKRWLSERADWMDNALK